MVFDRKDFPIRIPKENISLREKSQKAKKKFFSPRNREPVFHEKKTIRYTMVKKSCNFQTRFSPFLLTFRRFPSFSCFLQGILHREFLIKASMSKIKTQFFVLFSAPNRALCLREKNYKFGCNIPWSKTLEFSNTFFSVSIDFQAFSFIFIFFARYFASRISYKSKYEQNQNAIFALFSAPNRALFLREKN